MALVDEILQIDVSLVAALEEGVLERLCAAVRPNYMSVSSDLLGAIRARFAGMGASSQVAKLLEARKLQQLFAMATTSWNATLVNEHSQSCNLVCAKRAHDRVRRKACYAPLLGMAR